MKFLRYLIYVIVAVLLLYLLLCFVGPKGVSVERSVVIDTPVAIPYNLVEDLKKWETWSPWAMSDTTMVTTYGEVTSGQGASSTWASTNQGTGSQKFVEVELNKRIKTELAFDGFGRSGAEITFAPDGDGTKVNWDFASIDPYPFLMRGMMLFMGMEGELEKNYDEGLANIKRIAEDRYIRNKYGDFEIKEVLLEDQHFIHNRQKVNLANVTQFYAANLGALFGKVNESGVETAGMPCGLFFDFDNGEGTADMSAAIPTKQPVSIEGASSITLSGKSALQIDYYGDYSSTITAHDAMDEFLKDRGYFQDPPIIEQYVTDPSTESDPSKWLTKITYFYSE